ncbi:2-oxo acid dehydrogenase subunit E2 [Candidatus Pacearchaeota archaeon]|nr:2-oxo acid dehydrogenase subunit E2 [Candidatus Pacearchaeota archaeon]
MITEFKLPDIGEGIAEAEIVEWTVKEGDFVNAYQNIVKIETDKAVADLPSPVTGTMLKINFQKGDKVNVGAVLCVIGEKGEKVKSSANKKFDKGANDVVNNTRDSVGKESVVSGKILASPAVRKVAVERGIDLNNLKGSGADGQIVMSDLDKNGFSKVTEIVETSPALNIQKKYDQFGYIDRIPFKGVRKLIAQNMIRSLSQSAQVTSMEDIDVGRLWAMRLREKEHFALEGVKLTFMPFVIKALIKALTKHPKLNSSLEGESIVMKKYYNIGVAVQTDAGLLVPVVKIAERKSISDIAKEIEQLAEKCRNRTIDIMDLKGSTFTVTNYGSIGGTYGTPIINPGESAILGLGRIFDRVVLDSSGKVKNVKILPISLTFDHQIIDGAEAAEFIQTLKEYLESPEHLLEK